MFECVVCVCVSVYIECWYVCVCLDHRMPRPEILLLYIGDRISVALAGSAELEETLWERVTLFQAPHPFLPRPHGRVTCLLALYLRGVSLLCSLDPREEELPG